MATLPKGTIVETTNLQPGELIHTDFDFYNATSICGFTFTLTVLYANIRMIWLFTTEYKIYPIRIIGFILTTMKIEQHICKHVRFDEYGALKNQ